MLILLVRTERRAISSATDYVASEPDFLGTLVSYSSYLASHASQSTRARLYCRLAFAVVAILVEEGPQVLLSTQYACDVRLCRQVGSVSPYSYHI